MEDYSSMGKESILCFVGNEMKMCFGMMGAGIHAAHLDHVEQSYFRKSDEMYYHRRITELLKAYKKADYILPPYRQEFIDILKDLLPGLKEVLDDCADMKLISKKRWGKIFEIYFDYVKHTLITLN